MLRAYEDQIRTLAPAVEALLTALVFALILLLPGLSRPGPDVAFAELRLLVPAAVASLTWALALEELGLYGSQRLATGWRILSRLCIAWAASTSLQAATVFAVAAPVAPAFPIVCGLAQLVAISGFRLSIVTVLRLLRRHGRNFRNLLIVGSGPRAQAVVEAIERHPQWGLRIAGLADDDALAMDPRLRSRKTHKFVDVPDLLRDQVIDEVIVACPRSMLDSIDPVVGICSAVGIPITLLSDLFGDTLPPPRVTRFNSLAALRFARVSHSPLKLAIKRAIDVVGATLMLAAAAPVIGLAALAIRRTSPGPAFFRQVRCGLNGRRFEMLKLRTMYADAELRRADLLTLNEMQGPVFKIQDDPRVTPIGRVLRRWSLDELPQLINVLKGDMSLVGPRPPLPTEVDLYATFERRRLSMRPGLTCLWQVEGRNTIGFDDWVELDLRYIDTWSFSNDAAIMLRTIPAVLRRTGAS